MDKILLRMSHKPLINMELKRELKCLQQIALCILKKAFYLYIIFQCGGMCQKYSGCNKEIREWQCLDSKQRRSRKSELSPILYKKLNAISGIYHNYFCLFIFRIIFN